MKIKIIRTDYGHQVHVYVPGDGTERAYAHVMDGDRVTQQIESYADTCLGLMVFCDDEPEVTWVDK